MIMQLNQIKSKLPRVNKKRIGRGGKKGTYSGRGIKGQKSRAGGRSEPMIRPLIKRFHKLKGIGFSNSRWRIVIVSLEDLEKNFAEGETVSIKTLKEKKMIALKPGKKVRVKVLKTGDLKKKLIFEGCQFSKAAREAVEKTGSQIKE